MSAASICDLQRQRNLSLGSIACPLLVGALLLAACGGSSDESSQSTIALGSGSTAFVVRPPITTVPPSEVSVPPDGVSTAAQEYTIQGGDYPLKVANQFGIGVDELIAFNEWGSASEFPFPGTVIQIPPGATVAAAVTTTTSPTATAGSAAPAATIPDVGDNCGAGEHTVEAGDIPISVAEKYDVTLDALNAANASNPAYGQFIPGQTIIIPGKTDC